MPENPLKYRASQNGRFIKEDGSTANVADMMEALYNGGKVINTRLIASIPYSEITNGSTIKVKNILTPNAKNRIFTLYNNTDQNTALIKASVYDNDAEILIGKGEIVLQDNAGNNNSDTIIGTGLHRGKMAVIGSNYPNDTNGGNTSSLSNAGDSLLLVFSIPSPVPTSGTLDIYCKEIL